MRRDTEDGIIAVIMSLGCLLWLLYVGLIIAGLYFLVRFLATLS